MTQAAPSEPPDDALTLSTESAEALVARLGALAQAARVFGSGLAGVDVHIGWSLHGEEEEIRWTDPGSGRPRVRVQLDLGRMIQLLQPEPMDGEAVYLDAFKAGFLHELGHILYSGESICAFTDPERNPFACVTLDGAQAALAAVPGVREVLRQVCLTLEDARIERQLTGAFRGAGRFLEGHARRALDIAHGRDELEAFSWRGGEDARSAKDHITRLVAVLFLQIWGLDHRLERDQVPARVLASAESLRDSLRAAVEGEDPLDLAAWVGRYLLPEIQQHLEQVAGTTPGAPSVPGGQAQSDSVPPEEDVLEGSPGGASREADRQPPRTSERGAPQQPGPRGEAGEPAGPTAADTSAGKPAGQESLPALSREIEELFAAPDLLLSGGRGHRLAERDREEKTGALDSQIILYPHVDGRMVLDELPVAQATSVQQTERTAEVARDVVEIYGPMALAAFSGEAAALRRAFQVNYERRVSGRYRAGKRVGIANVRRFITSEDLRLFQKIELPDRLSYYFHLLVDVSPSMLTNKNAQKAIATAYAFADSLDRLRVPVDVTLYSSAVTVLYDHRIETLDRFFGGRFGYLSSGTHEIEAIAYAKQCADTVAQERKVLVVVTDGHPNSLALRRAGAADLREYYRSVLIPWLAKARIDLMAIGIGTSPSYHEDAVTISSGWESIAVLMRLLDDIIARGERSHSALWV